MNKNFYFVSLAALGAVAFVGCQSGPKLAWWKKDRLGDEAVAELVDPADAAKLTSNAKGTSAPPFVPGTSADKMNQLVTAATAPKNSLPSGYAAAGSSSPLGGTAYPSTGVASASPAEALAAVRSSARGQASGLGSDSLGKMGMPYDPNAVPESASAVASTTVPSATTDALASVDRYGNSAAAHVAGAPNSYAGSVGQDYNTPAANTSSANNYAASAASSSVSSPATSGDRYSTSSGGALAAADDRYQSAGGQVDAGNATGGYPSNSLATTNASSDSASANMGDMAHRATGGVENAMPGERSEATNQLASNATPAYRPGGTSSYGAGGSLGSGQFATTFGAENDVEKVASLPSTTGSSSQATTSQSASVPPTPPVAYPSTGAAQRY